MIGPCRFGAHLNRLPDAGVGDMVMASVKKGKPELRKKSEFFLLVDYTGMISSTDRLLFNSFFQLCLSSLSVSAKHGVGEMACSYILRYVIALHCSLYFEPIFTRTMLA